MDLWFSERHTPNVKFSIRVDRQLYCCQSEFQRIDVFESKDFGRFLTLDGYMMMTEKDEFIYHEMIVHCHFEDGLKFVRAWEDYYDLIIVDSTDPFGPGEGLFTREFYGNCFKALHEDGIMVNQHESPFYAGDAIAMQRAHKRIVESFPISRVYQAHIPTYPSGHWLFGFASKRYHPVHDLQAVRWNTLGLATRYYNTKLHVGAFALPGYVEELLRDVE